MQCPYCGSDSGVVDSRAASDGRVRRRRVCTACKRRFTTYEKLAPPNLKVHKRSGKSEPFDTGKLARALSRVCRHRPAVSDDDVLRIARDIEAKLVDSGARTIDSLHIAELALARLAEIDRVAHDRYAVDYRDEHGRIRTDTTGEDEAASTEQLGLFGDDEG